MKFGVIVSSVMLVSLMVSNANAGSRKEAEERELAATGSYTQSVHVVNLLANGNIADPGMTRTPILVKYYNGNQWPCWTYTINYQDDYTIHAGPTQGCQAKVEQVLIEPIIVADRLNTYRVPDRVRLDTSKYSSHVIVTQADAPVFDTQSGLVNAPGNVKIQVQADPQ